MYVCMYVCMYKILLYKYKCKQNKIEVDLYQI